MAPILTLFPILISLLDDKTTLDNPVSSPIIILPSCNVSNDDGFVRPTLLVLCEEFIDTLQPIIIDFDL